MNSRAATPQQKISASAKPAAPASLAATNGRQATAARPPFRRNQSPGKLDALTPPQREQLLHWLVVDGITYADAQERIEKQFGIKCLSLRPIFSFFHKHCAPVESPAHTASAVQPLVEVSITTAAASLRIAVMPSGEVITTKGNTK